MYVFTDSEGWINNIAVADKEIPEITSMGGVYLDDLLFVDVYKNLSWYKIINSQPVKQETERPPEPPREPTLEEKMSNLETENTLLKAQAKANADIADFHEELIVELAMMVYQ